MFDVVSRWQVVWSKKPSRARDTNDATACGAAAPSSSIVMSPAVVRSVVVQVRPSASERSGTFGSSVGSLVGASVAGVVAGVVTAGSGAATASGRRRSTSSHPPATSATTPSTHPTTMRRRRYEKWLAHQAAIKARQRRRAYSRCCFFEDNSRSRSCLSAGTHPHTDAAPVRASVCGCVPADRQERERELSSKKQQREYLSLI